MSVNDEEKMKVGILLGPNARGGMERQANLLANGLVARGGSVRIIFNSRPSRSREGMNWAGIPTQYLWRYNPIKKLSQRYLGFLLKQHKIDLLHVFYWGNMEFAAGAMKWAPDVVFVGSQRDTDFVTREEVKQRLKQACISYNQVTCNSLATRDLMSALHICKPEKVKVIYNGIVLPEHPSVGVVDTDPQRVRTILFPNRLFAYKNPLLFVDACAEVCRRIENVRVIVCGWGDLEEAMKRRCEEVGIAGKCRFLGSLLPEEIPYGEADLVVNSSSSLEGMSNTLMEAMAHGVPVVATKVGGNPELLGRHDFGRIVPIDDRGGLADAMCELLSVTPQKRAALGGEAREYMARRFSVDHFVDEHVRYYEELLLEKRAQMKWKPGGAR